MAEVDIKKLSVQLDAAQAIIDQIRISSGCQVFGPARAITNERVNMALVAARKAFEDRRARTGFIGSDDIFGEPAWDILLDLFIRQADEEKNRVKSYLNASATPSTTIRWLKVLAQTGLVQVDPDPDKSGHSLVHLTPAGYEGMLRYLESIAS